MRPTETNPVVLLRDGTGRLEMRRWGLVPSWVKDPKAVNNPINAVGETAPEKPFLRMAFHKRRCIVPANAFFEWTRVPGEKRKTKYRITRADGTVQDQGCKHDASEHVPP